MGLLRLFLAAVVLAEHLREFVLAPLGMNNGTWNAGLTGQKAVMCFYIISGFLIALVLDRRYGFDARGTAKFYVARFSRIYSLYWPLFAVMVATGFTSHITGLTWDWLTGTFLFGADWRVGVIYPTQYYEMFPSALAPAWTLGAEMNILCIGAVPTARHKTCACDLRWFRRASSRHQVRSGLQ